MMPGPKQSIHEQLLFPKVVFSIMSFAATPSTLKKDTIARMTYGARVSLVL